MKWISLFFAAALTSTAFSQAARSEDRHQLTPEEIAATLPVADGASNYSIRVPPTDRKASLRGRSLSFVLSPDTETDFDLTLFQGGILARTKQGDIFPDSTL